MISLALIVLIIELEFISIYMYHTDKNIICESFIISQNKNPTCIMQIVILVQHIAWEWLIVTMNLLYFQSIDPMVLHVLVSNKQSID